MYFALVASPVIAGTSSRPCCAHQPVRNYSFPHHRCQPQVYTTRSGSHRHRILPIDGPPEWPTGFARRAHGWNGNRKRP